MSEEREDFYIGDVKYTRPKMTPEKLTKFLDSLLKYCDAVERIAANMEGCIRNDYIVRILMLREKALEAHVILRTYYMEKLKEEEKKK